MTVIEPSTDAAQSMHGHVDQYTRGLITLRELLLAIETRGKYTNIPVVLSPPIIADPDLAVTFTEKGICALLARVNGMRELGELHLSTFWTASDAGDALTTHVLLEGDDGTDPEAYEWIMPSIRFPMPAGSLRTDKMADGHRRLRVLDGTLMFAES